METYFFDTSALAKAYRRETGTDRVMAILAEERAKHYISSLTVVEFQSVFAQKVRMGLLEPSDFQLVCRKLGGDIKSQRLFVKGMLRRHQHAAEKLIAHHAPLRRLRKLDALQLAIASELWSAGAVAHFVVSDVHLGSVAELEGVPVINPDVL